MGSRRLKDTLPEFVILLFKRRGASVDESTNTITATQKQTRHTVDRKTQALLKERGQLIVSG